MAFHLATNLLEDTQGERGSSILKLVTDPVPRPCFSSARYTQGQGVPAAETVDIETSLRDAPFVDEVNKSRTGQATIEIPQVGTGLVECADQFDTSHTKNRASDRESLRPELAYHGGPIQTGQVQFGVDTRVSFKSSLGSEARRSEARRTEAPRSNPYIPAHTLGEALQRRSNRGQ
jgi:hypothetical protein